MKKYNYSSIIGIIAFFVLAAGCQDNQLLNTGESLVAGVTGVSEVGVAGIWIDPIGNLELSQSQLNNGYVVTITGWTGYLSSPSGGNNPRLTELHLEVNKDGEIDIDSELIWNIINTWDSTPLTSIILSGRDNKPGREFDGVFASESEWNITETGTYLVRARAIFTGGDDQETTEDVVVTLEQSFEVEFPAAPAIAARILEANDVSHRYGKGKNGGNYIADVARHMGPGTDFDGESKELWEDDEKVMNQAYWDAVWDFLKNATGEELENTPQGYVW